MISLYVYTAWDEIERLALVSNFNHIWVLRHVRASLRDDDARTIAYGIICSKFDYCNSLLTGTTKSNLAKL